MSAKVKALQQWCKIQCEGYRDVNIVNMTSSWKSGLAFCAIIHRYRPDLIDYDSLSKKNVYDNNKLAFDVGASLGIPVLLDPEDMVSMSVPDRLCIITYVSQYYNYFHKYAPVGGPSVSMTSTVKRPSEGIQDEAPKRRAVEAVGGETKINTMQDKCTVCLRKVYLMERHIDHNKLYHRQCFRAEQKSADNAVQSNGDHHNAAASVAAAASTEPVGSASADHRGLSSPATGAGAGSLTHVTPSSAEPEPTKMDVVRQPQPTTSVTSTSSNLMKSLYSTAAYQSNANTNATVTTQIKPLIAAGDALPAVNDVPMSVSVATSAVLVTGNSRTTVAVSSSNSGSVPVSAANGGSTPVSSGNSTATSNVPMSTPLPVPRGILKVKSPNATSSIDVTTTSHQPTPRLDQNSNSIADHETQSNPAPENSDKPRGILKVRSTNATNSSDINTTSHQQTPRLDQNSNSVADHETESKNKAAGSSEKRRDVKFSEPETPKTEQPPKSNNSSSVLAGLMHSLSAVRRSSSGSTSPRGESGDLPVSFSPTVVSPSAGATSNVCNVSSDHRTELVPAARPAVKPSDTVVAVPPSSMPSSDMPLRKAPEPTHHSLSSVTSVTSVASPATATVASPVAPVPPVASPLLPSTSNSRELDEARQVAVVSPSISVKEHASKQPEIRQTGTIEGLDKPGLSTGGVGHRSESAILACKVPEKIPPSVDLHKPLAAVESRVPPSPVLPSNAAVTDKPIHQVAVPASVETAGRVPSAVGHPDVSRGVTAHEYSPTTGRKIPTRPAPPSPVVIVKSSAADKTSPAIGRAVPFRAAPSPFSPTSVSPLPSTPSTGTTVSSVITTPYLTPTVSSPSAVLTTSNTPAHSMLISPPAVVPTGMQNVTVVHTSSDIPSKSTEKTADKQQHTSENKSESESGDSEKVTLRPVPSPRQGIPSKPPRISLNVESEQSTTPNTNTSNPQQLLKKTDQFLAPQTNSVEPCPKPRPRSPARGPSPRQPSPVHSDDSLQLPKPKPRKPEMPTLDAEECKPEPESHGIPDKAPVVGAVSTGAATCGGVDVVTMRNIENRRTPVVPARPGSSTGTLPRTVPGRPFAMVETGQPAAPTAPVDVSPGGKVAVKVVGSDNKCSPAPSAAMSPGGSSDTPQPPQRFKKGQKRMAPPPPPPPSSTAVQATISSPPPTVSGPSTRPAVTFGHSGNASPRAAVGVAPRDPSLPQTVTLTNALAPPRPETAENTRKKITPDVKFTFDKDAFRTSVVAPIPGGTLTKRAVPSRPAPPSPAVANIVKRQITAEERMPVDVIKERLSVLEEQLRVLERNGRTLEDRIRRHDDDVVFEDEDEVMMVEWFEMSNKKNELVREESELIYKLKQQDLEDQHSQVEYELRRLMAIPDHAKTENDKAREAFFIQQLIVTVHRRNNIVDSIEQDRLRYIQEDEEISHMMSTKSSKGSKGTDRKKKSGR